MAEYTLKTNFTALVEPYANEYLIDFRNIVEKAFVHSDSRPRLLGNLLVLERYCNTVQQGLTADKAQLCVCLRYAQGLLWDYLGGRVAAADFQDFANDYYAWLLEHNVGPEGFCSEHFAEYFADSCPDAYEWFAVEWSSGLLMQLVSIEGGRVDHEDFEECEKLDFYGPLCMLDMMEDVCIGLTDTPVVSNRGTDLEKAMTQVRKTSLFQEIVMHVQNDLQTALLAAPAEYEALRKEYAQYTIIPEQYAAWMWEY